ncbi:5-carboxymethyl-2-hydroxymuconate Delta-isomerase [Cochlodiniinecator piscidefendens]|uniref:5-carboxymethyl-2-hydroxymuconate Delta-isomerase n=1 Tax=Cochlodiniinecator piscidefendens TaxID=2715756 RepID=UPI00140C9943|nr:5-carboxymethyl-2-hydroxymuconate Delta-isomerase [Cochlodiniinecator piscidefendens]
MPHFSIEYSRNLESLVDIAGLCDALRAAGIETGVFPMAGIRVRAFACDHYSIADGQPDRAFIDLSVRLRGGRTLEVRKAATQAIFQTAETFLSEVMDKHPIALSMEMRDIDPDLSPKLNSIRKFLSGEG